MDTGEAQWQQRLACTATSGVVNNSNKALAQLLYMYGVEVTL
ncbi:unnamed protein product [Ectocarpus sp. 8 AP-2014]